MVRTPEGTIYCEDAAASPTPDPADLEEANARILHNARIYLIVCAGLLVSAAFSLILGSGESLSDHGPIGFRLAWNQILFIAELALVPFIADKAPKISPGIAAALFASYAVLNGLTFPGFFFWMRPEDVARLFAATAAAYGTLGFLYWIRKRELSGFGGLIALIVVGLIPAAIASIGMSRSVRNSCLIAVPAFLAAAFYYDRELAESYQTFEDDDSGWKGSLAGAFFLYFAFVNLILVVQYAIARFFQDSKERDERL